MELAAEAGMGEVQLPTAVLGSAMSVNSFMGFASILWAMAINGAILDAYKTNPGVGFSIIFVFVAGVGVVGAVLAFWLHRLNRCAGSDGQPPSPLSPGFMRCQSGLRLRYAGMKGKR
ncbi:hypothetical protein [Mobiluncus mulieris]|uniref:hypothetical protein n=1 Tax=Mobiluncus mulieris TaxID=2052 RepID=UPI00215D661E|nr:hypothetical protein [Mobiluncus mulieris]